MMIVMILFGFAHSLFVCLFCLLKKTLRALKVCLGEGIDSYIAIAPKRLQC